MRERKRENERERMRERERVNESKRERARQTDRQTDKQLDSPSSTLDRDFFIVIIPHGVQQWYPIVTCKDQQVDEREQNAKPHEEKNVRKVDHSQSLQSPLSGNAQGS